MYKKSKIAMVTNIPSPYRVELYYYMQTHIDKYEFYVIYTDRNEDNRQWSLDESKLLNSTILKSKVIKIKGQDDRYIHFPGDIRRCLNGIAPDIVIASEYNPAALQSLIWCKMHQKKFIHLTDGTLYSERNIGIVQKLARKIIISKADAFVASSSRAKEKLVWWGAPNNKVFISLLTIDVNKYREVEREPQDGRILYVGRMTKQKGLDLLINAVAEMTAKFNLRIVGSGSEDEIRLLKTLAIEKKISDKIVWCGFKEGKELLDEYRKAELFVLPSRGDCFGLVLVEALCAKLPIVASKYADGACDVVREGVNGCIVDPFDEKAFGKTISKALMDEEMKNRAVKESFEKFTFENVMEGYLEAIKSVAK